MYDLAIFYCVAAVLTVWTLDWRKVPGVVVLVAILLSGSTQVALYGQEAIDGYVLAAGLAWLFILTLEPLHRVRVSPWFLMLAGGGTLALGLGLLPGINRIEIGTGEGSDISINAGKAMGALLLGSTLLSRPSFEWRPIDHKRVTYIAGAAAASVLCLGAYWVHDGWTTVPASLPALLAINLLVTCVAEEIFFRRLLLDWQLSRMPAILALVVNAALFAVVHLGFGGMFMGLAFLAGLLYGAAYLLTRRLSVAILAHWLVNIPVVMVLNP